MKHTGLFVTIVILSVTRFVQAQDTAVVDSAIQLSVQTDSAMADQETDSLDAQQIVPMDSVTVAEKADSLSVLPKPEIPEEEKIEKIDVVRHEFKYRQQVGTALGMMAFIVIILTSVQSWNPD